MPHRISSRRRPFWHLLTLAATAFLVAAVALATGAAQAAGAPDLVTRKVRFRGGEDLNVKPGGDVNVRKPAADGVPPAKTPEGRASCSVTFDNDTALITKTYIDGMFAGTIRPFGELSAPSVPGSTVLYARAEYDDGSADAWGPIRVGCRTKFRWRLSD